jgi:NADPH:quinone reductase-like Zn-dependent oxidoreductase
VRSFGATPIDYRTEDFVERIGELTGEGVDIVFDPVGGGKQLRRSYRCLRKGGQLVWFGIAASKERGLRLIPGTLFWRFALSVWPDGKSAPLTPDLSEDNEWYQRTQTELLGMLASGQLTPLIAEKIPLAEAWRAHELLENGRYAGKVVLVTNAYESGSAPVNPVAASQEGAPS